MQMVSVTEQRAITGGHSHWECSKHKYKSVALAKKSDAAYLAGKHAGKYGHSKYVSYYNWCFC